MIKQQHKRKNVFEQHLKNYSLLFYSEAIQSIFKAIYNVSCI